MQDYQYSYSDGESGYYGEYLKNNASLARRAYSRYALALVLFNVISYAVIYGAQFLMIAMLGLEQTNALFSNVYVVWIFNVVPMYVIAFPCFYLMVKNMKVLRRARGEMKFGDMLLTFFIAQGVMMLGNYIGIFLNNLLSTLLDKPINNSTGDLIDQTPLWIIFCVVVIIGPIIEELMFRKLMIDRLSPYGTIGAIVFSSIAFGLFHGNFFQFFYATMVGLIFGYVYAKTGKVRHTIILHMMINFCGSILPMLMEKLSEYTLSIDIETLSGQLKFMFLEEIALTYIFTHFSIAILGIIILIVALATRKIKIENTRTYQIDAPRLTLSAVFNVGTLLFIAASIVIFAMEILL